MNLLIKEYLAKLKESKELDRVLPDLLLTMNYNVLIRPGSGDLQFGVDATATKTINNKPTLYIFTIKRGNIDSADWLGTPQSIHPSLMKIKDIYIPRHLSNEYKDYHKVVVLCTGGEMNQSIRQNDWDAFIDQYSIPGKLTFEFWGGDQLAPNIEEHMFNEHILTDKNKALLRKSIALAAEPDYDLIHFYDLLSSLLINKVYSSREKEKKALRTVHLCLNILRYWSKDEGNLKPTIKAAERTILNVWEFIRNNDHFNKPSLLTIVDEIYETVVDIHLEYIEKCWSHYEIQGAVSSGTMEFTLEGLNLYEQLGILANTCIFYSYPAANNSDTKTILNSKELAALLVTFIKNNPGILTPLYDDHIIEIVAAIHVLNMHRENEEIELLIAGLINSIAFAFINMEKYYPICTDNIHDLIAVNMSEIEDKNRFIKISTLLPILAHHCVYLGLNENYTHTVKTINEAFPDTFIQVWYPDKNTDASLYKENAGLSSGSMDIAIKFSNDISETKKIIQKVQKNTIQPMGLSSIKHGFHTLPFIACRHFRTPPLPFYWQLDI